MKDALILLKVLMLSTSQRNLFIHTRDKKKRGRVVGSVIGNTILYIFLVGFSILMCVGYGAAGFIESAPVMCALIISLVSFVFTLFKTNGYLFRFREYDMLMSLPFQPRTVAACKFLYMYLKSLPWYLSISIAMMIGYGVFQSPPVWVYFLWLLMSLFLPVIPMVIAAFFGFLVARVSVGFKKTQLVQTILTLIFVVFMFSIRYIIDALIQDDKINAVLEKASDVTGRLAGVYLPVRWFDEVITEGSISGLLLLLGCTVLIFSVVFVIVGNSYRKINSALQSHAAAKQLKVTAQKKRSVLRAIVFKEFKRMTGSTVVMTNSIMGVVLALLLSVVTLIFGFDRIVGIVTKDAPFDPAIVQPAIPFLVYFFVGMVSTACFTPSLEGKNVWIVQSMPITKKTLYQGKMLFNFILEAPFMMLSVLLIGLSAKVPVPEMIVYEILGVALCALSTAWGCVCGVRHMRLDWENEVEVVKQGTAVTLYLFPNMIVVLLLLFGVVFLGMRINHLLMTLVLALVAFLLAALSYARVMRLARD